jgi:large subunit ribosomal protein L13
MTVFEGPAHPYKDNLMKVGGKTRIADIPEVKEELARASSSVS